MRRTHAWNRSSGSGKAWRSSSGITGHTSYGWGQQGLERLTSPAQAGLDGALRDAQHRGDVRHGISLHVVQNQGHAQLFLEFQQRLAHARGPMVLLIITNFSPEETKKTAVPLSPEENARRLNRRKRNSNIKRAVLAAATVVIICVVGFTTYGRYSTKHSNELYVYNWGEYIDDSVIEQFREETGIEVTYDLFETNEEMYPVIEAGAVNYDVVCPSDYMIQKMAENGLLAEINFDNIPNLANIDPKFLEMSREFDPENLYSVPYTWGTVGILYNTKTIEERGLPVPKKWSDLWNPAYKGEILMQDSVRDAFMVALKARGYSMNTENINELQEAKADLIAQKPLVQAYVIDQVRDKMIGGEAALGVIFSGVPVRNNIKPDMTARYKQISDSNKHCPCKKKAYDFFCPEKCIP